MNYYERSDIPFFEGKMKSYRGPVAIRAVRIHGPFGVITRQGPMRCPDGYLAVDSAGWPYPIHKDKFEKIYVESRDALSENKTIKVDDATFCKMCGDRVAENHEFCEACNERREILFTKRKLKNEFEKNNRAMWIGAFGGSFTALLALKVLNAKGIYLGFILTVLLWFGACWLIKKIAEKVLS